MAGRVQKSKAKRTRKSKVSDQVELTSSDASEEEVSAPRRGRKAATSSAVRKTTKKKTSVAKKDLSTREKPARRVVRKAAASKKTTRSRPGRPTSIRPKTRGAKLLLDFLKENDLTQVEFARMIGMNHIRLNHLLSGRTDSGRCPEPTLREAHEIEKRTKSSVPPDSWLRGVPGRKAA